MTRDEWAEAIITLNQSYVAAVADLCRREPNMAGVYLNMSEEQVRKFGSITPADLIRLNAIPIALVSPLESAHRLISARSAEDILTAIQASIEAYKRESDHALR